MNEQYTVNYKGINLYSYKMTDYERDIVENLRRELLDICTLLDVPRGKCFDGSPYMGRLLDNYEEFILKFKDDTGYFALIGERGQFSFMKGFPIENREEAKFILLNSEFASSGFRYELNLRDELEKEWINRYSVEYDSRKAAFEYTIKMLKTVFDCFPDNIIDKYTNYMNKWFDSKHWYFDKNKLTFEEMH